jgi:hypothetical protein
VNADQAREALTAIEGARQRESFAFDPAAARAARNGARFGSASGPCVALRDYVALERPPLNPYLATRDGRTVLPAAASSARWDLRGGPPATAVPTAITSPPRIGVAGEYDLHSYSSLARVRFITLSPTRAHEQHSSEA